MARYTVRISTRSCCGRHRWPLIDIVETLANSGFEHLLLEEVTFAGACIPLALPLEIGLPGEKVQALVDAILDRLSQALGGNAFCFTGNLVVTASGAAEEVRAQEAHARIENKGLRARLEPTRFPAGITAL